MSGYYVVVALGWDNIPDDVAIFATEKQAREEWDIDGEEVLLFGPVTCVPAAREGSGDE